MKWLDEIEERERKTTSGPWRIGHLVTAIVNDGNDCWTEIPVGKCCICVEDGSEPLAVVEESHRTRHTHACLDEGNAEWASIYSATTLRHIINAEDGVCSKREDAEFIAHAREDVPRLCNAVRDFHGAILKALEHVSGPVADELRAILEKWEG